MNMLLPKTASSVSETELAVDRQAFEFLVESNRWKSADSPSTTRPGSAISQPAKVHESANSKKY